MPNQPWWKKALIVGAYMAGGALMFKLGEWGIRQLRKPKTAEASASTTVVR